MQENIKDQLHDLSQLNQNKKQYRIHKNNKIYDRHSYHQISDWSENQDSFYPIGEKLNPQYHKKIIRVATNLIKPKKQIHLNEQKFILTSRKPQFRSQSCQLKPVKIKFGSPQGMKGFQKSFYQNNGKKVISVSNYTSVYQQYRMKKESEKKQKLNEIQNNTNTNNNQINYKCQSSLIARILNRRRKRYKQDNNLLKNYLIMHKINASTSK